MIVVSDSSPLNILVRIGHVDVLPILFRHVLIPRVATFELTQPRTPEIVKKFLNDPHDWLSVRDPTQLQEFVNLDAGECAAISLAVEIAADFILVDERAGRRAAQDLRLNVIGTLGILELAAQRRMIDLMSAFEKLKQTDFYFHEELLDSILERNKKGTT